MMRKLLYEASISSGYNLSSSYGLDDNCVLPNSCVRGDQLFLVFGHAIDVDKVVRSQSDILISTFREPLSWILSRWKHAYKFNNEKNSLLQAAKDYGSKYFNFADTETKNALTIIYKKLTSGHTLGDIMKGDIDSAIRRVRRLFQLKCIVLIYDFLGKSVEHVSLVVGNKILYGLFSGKYKHVYINKGPQDRYVSEAMRGISDDTTRRVRDMMSLHYMIYQEALSEFERQAFTPPLRLRSA